MKRYVIIARALGVFFLTGCFFFAFHAHATINPLAWYYLGEADGVNLTNGVVATNTMDSAGTNNLVALNGPVYSTNVAAAAAARTGSTLSLNFSGGQRATNGVVTAVTNNFGIEAWVLPTTNSGTHIIAHNGVTGNNGWGLRQVDTNFYGVFAGVTNFGVASVATNVWIHLALVNDNGVSTLYTNGVPAGTTTASPFAPQSRFGLGGQTDANGGAYFQGNLDEVRVFTFLPGQFSTNDLLYNTMFFSFITNLDSTITITSYNGSSGNVAVPGTIYGHSVTSIGDYAFNGSSGLTNVTLGSSVTSIGNWAFAFCSSLMNAPVSNKVTSIGNEAFYGCSGLRLVTIGSSVTNLGDSPFASCSGLTNIAVQAGNASYGRVGGVLFNRALTTLIQYPAGLAGGYVIPNSVTTIANGAFSGCLGLTSATIPSSVTSLGSEVFSACSGLTNVTIPNVPGIGNYTFYGCSGLTSVTIPASVTNVGSFAFYGCSGLTNAILGNNVASLGDYAFFGCLGLTNATIPNGVNSIGNDTFSGCVKLASVTIGSGVTNIGDSAFADCPVLTSFVVNTGNVSYAGTGGVLFNHALTRLIQCPVGLAGGYVIPGGVNNIADSAFAGCSSLTSVTIPNSVTSIGNRAFHNCFGLTNVTVPDSVGSIGGDAYSGSGLHEVTIGNGVTNLGTFAFYACTSLHQAYFRGNPPKVAGAAGNVDTTVFLAESGTVYYLPGTTGWGGTFGSWPTALWNPQIQRADGGFGVRTNRFGFNITGNVNLPVAVATCTNLGDVWVPVFTGTLTNGSLYFSDPQWTNYPRRFYRVQWQ